MRKPAGRALSLARRLAKRSLAPWVWLETYRCLRLPWKQAQAVRPAAAESTVPVEVRRLQRSDLLPYSSESEYEISPRFLDGIAGRDDLCFGAFVGGQLVSYRFFAVAPTAIDSYLRFHFPPRWIYAYKAFTHPSWRARRLHRQLFLGSLPEVGRWLQGLQEPLGFVTLVVSDNIASSSALAHLGFSPFESFSVLRIRSRPRLVSPPEEDRTGFYIELTGTQ
jgi:hypothetical protein